MKTFKGIIVVLVLLALSCVVIPGFMYSQETAGQIYERGLYLEESQGDLKGAIALYENVVKDNNAERAIAARAQLHIGMCYEKLGLREAQMAYQKVVDNYPQQQQEVASARQRLATLSRIVNAVKEPAFTARQVWANPNINHFVGAPSPDGRYLSFLDWYTGDLAIRNLEAGTNRPLTNEGSWREPLQNAVNCRWSPDSKQIAYGWNNGINRCVELRVVAQEGGKPRTLLDCEDERLKYMLAFDWSPDGKQILIFLAEGNKPQRQIVLVSAVDGTTKIVKTFQGGLFHPETMCFSRDGRYIAYDQLQNENSNERDIFLISADGGDEVSVVKHPAHDFLLGWSPNREGILFASERTGSIDLWFLAVSEGKVQGEPELIKRGIGRMGPLGLTQSGSYFYLQGETGLPDVYVVKMDSQSGKILAQPETVVRRFVGYNFQPEYSPDGKYLAYTTTRNRALSISPIRRNAICIRSLETGEEQEFTTKFYNIVSPQWSPDGQIIYFGAMVDQVGGGLYQIDTQNGEVTPIQESAQGHPPGTTLIGWEITPDGKSMIYERQIKPNEPFQILIRNPWTGEEKQTYEGNLAMFTISPDGGQLALKVHEGKQKVVQAMPISGGQPKELLRYEEQEDYLGQIEWTADGKYVLFTRLQYIQDKRHLSLWRIAAEGGEPQDLNLVMASFEHLSAHPDGQHLAFGSTGFTQKAPAVWVMENILQPAASASK